MSKRSFKGRSERGRISPDRGSPKAGGRSSSKGGGGHHSAAGLYLYGKHAVLAALQNAQRTVLEIYATSQNQNLLAGQARDIPIRILDKEALSRLLPEGAVHQGIAARVEPLPPRDLEEFLQNLPDQPRHCFVLLDQVTDPHNVGAILRSAAAFGASGVIMQTRNAPPETGTLAKSASGALDVVPILHVTNLSRALEHLKEYDFWSIGFDSEAPTTLNTLPSFERSVLILGAEGSGVRPLVQKHCDHFVRLPTVPPIASLNVSNAAAVALYHVMTA